MAVFAPTARDGRYEVIAEGSGQRDIGGQGGGADPVFRPYVAQGAPMLPHPPAVLRAARRQVEVLPAPQIEERRRILGEAGRDAAFGSALDETDHAVAHLQHAALGRIERHGAGVRPFQHRDAGEVQVLPPVVRDLQPGQAAVGAPLHAAGAGQVAGDVPGTMVEVARIARPEVVAADLFAIQPQFAQQLDVGGRVQEATAVAGLEFIATALHGIPHLPPSQRHGANLSPTASRHETRIVKRQ